MYRFHAPHKTIRWTGGSAVCSASLPHISRWIHTKAWPRQNQRGFCLQYNIWYFPWYLLPVLFTTLADGQTVTLRCPCLRLIHSYYNIYQNLDILSTGSTIQKFLKFIFYPFLYIRYIFQKKGSKVQFFILITCIKIKVYLYTYYITCTISKNYLLFI